MIWHWSSVEQIERESSPIVKGNAPGVPETTPALDVDETLPVALDVAASAPAARWGGVGLPHAVSPSSTTAPIANALRPAPMTER